MRDRYSRCCLMMGLLVAAGVGLMSCGTQPLAPAARAVPPNAIDPADPALSNRELEPLEMKLEWRMAVAIGDQRHDIRQMFIHRDYCFAETIDAYLFAYNCREGVQRWLLPMNGPLFLGPVVSDSYAFAIARNRLYYVRRNSGVIDREEPPRSAVAVMETAGDNIIMGSGDNRITLYDTKKSEHVWNVGITGPVLSRPLVFGDRIVVVGWNAAIVSLGIDAGQQEWTFRPKESMFTRGICTDGKLIYGVGADSMLYALSPTSGEVKWQYPTGAPANDDPVYAGGRLYAFCYKAGMLCFDPANPGPAKWKQPRARGFVAAGLKRTYAVLDNGNLGALDPATGEVLWERPLPDDVIVVRNIYSDVVILATKNGFIIALKEIG